MSLSAVYLSNAIFTGTALCHFPLRTFVFLAIINPLKEPYCAASLERHDHGLGIVYLVLARTETRNKKPMYICISMVGADVYRVSYSKLLYIRLTYRSTVCCFYDIVSDRSNSTLTLQYGTVRCHCTRSSNQPDSTLRDLSEAIIYV